MAPAMSAGRHRFASREGGPTVVRAQTAVVALHVRYLKRVGAHLLNILSSVVSHVERIDYREQDQT